MAVPLSSAYVIGIGVALMLGINLVEARYEIEGKNQLITKLTEEYSQEASLDAAESVATEDLIKACNEIITQTPHLADRLSSVSNVLGAQSDLTSTQSALIKELMKRHPEDAPLVKAVLSIALARYNAKVGPDPAK